MSRLEPRNRMEAFAHQIKDDADKLMGAAVCDAEETYEKFIDNILSQIAAYRNKTLRKAAETYRAKQEKKDAENKKRFPSLYK